MEYGKGSSFPSFWQKTAKRWGIDDSQLTLSGFLVVGSAADVAAATNLILTTGHHAQSLGVGEVLLVQDSLCQRVRVVPLEDRDGSLHDDGAVIEFVIDEMHCAAGDPDPISEGLFLRLETWKSRQQRRMNVNDAVWESGDKAGREEAHVPGQADQIHMMLFEAAENIGVVCFSRAPLGGVERRGQPEFLGRGQAGGAGDVGDDDGNLHTGQAAGPDGIRDGQEVRAAAGEEDAEAERWSWLSSLRHR